MFITPNDMKDEILKMLGLPKINIEIAGETEKERYFSALNQIKAVYQSVPYEYLDPYFFDWFSIFTPIENSVWCDIRSTGIPFMPQYPAGNYFLDFADPVNKIAIECDGKEFHDKQKDKKRDAELSKSGWTVYRLTGAECNRLFEHDIFDSEFYNDNQSVVSEWINNSSEGFIYALKTRKYKNAEPSKFEVTFERDIDKTLYEHDSSNK